MSKEAFHRFILFPLIHCGYCEYPENVVNMKQVRKRKSLQISVKLAITKKESAGKTNL